MHLTDRREEESTVQNVMFRQAAQTGKVFTMSVSVYSPPTGITPCVITVGENAVKGGKAGCDGDP